MCGRHQQFDEPSITRTHERGYEGETVRLETYPPVQSIQRKHAYQCGGFPWWTLWLIWPLFGVLKGVFGALGAAATAFFVALPTFGPSIATFWPIALVIVGLLLLRRR